jgi:arginyl-tRNA synthetase
MVDLPSGKMKSREGTVVDADDLIADMIAHAKEQTEALGKIDDFTEDEKTALFQTIGLGALKFFLLRVDPKKRILFDPKESIDLHGLHWTICAIYLRSYTKYFAKSKSTVDHRQ